MHFNSIICTRFSNYSWILSFFVCITNLQACSVDSQVVVDLTFLSNLNESKLHQSEHHVVTINIPFKNASYTMHLTKPADLFIPEHIDIGEDEMEDYLCMYTGTITSSGGVVGMASLSSCFQETGFEGMLYLGNEHYHITPYLQSSAHRNKRSADKLSKTGCFSKVKMKHTIEKLITSPSQKHRNDARRVPDEALKAARKQMMKDQEVLEDERENDDNSEETDIDNVEQVFSPSMDEISVNNADLDEIVNEVESVNGSILRTKSTSNARRQIKSTKNTAKIIELAIFTDEAFYREWARQSPQDTVKKINQYLLALVNDMNYLYEQPSLGTKITFRLVNVGILRTNPNGLHPSTSAEKYLDNFCLFAGKINKHGAKWDHAMMITGLELEDEKGGDNLGITFTSTMCLRYWSCSVLKYNKGFETVFTAAHELGHSLGIEHDGETINVKCDPSKFIMAANEDSGQTNWSPCSNENLKNFLDFGDPRARFKDSSSIPRCLMKRGAKSLGIRYRTGRFPGQTCGVRSQCNQACHRCTPYIKNQAPYNNVCKVLHCQTPCSEIFPAHPALEGTSCGPNGQNFCRNGRCQCR